jgi:hypothetical protein
MQIGLTEVLALIVSLGLPLLAFVLAVVWIGRRARLAGYASRKAYVRATPQTDAQKEEAIDLLVRGVVLCALGLLFRPLVLVGVVPLYVGGRKVLRAWFALGSEDA